MRDARHSPVWQMENPQYIRPLLDNRTSRKWWYKREPPSSKEHPCSASRGPRLDLHGQLHPHRRRRHQPGKTFSLVNRAVNSKAYPSQNANFRDHIHKVIVTQVCKSLQNNKQSLWRCMKGEHRALLSKCQVERQTSHAAQVAASSISVKISLTVDLLAIPLPVEARATPERAPKHNSLEILI